MKNLVILKCVLLMLAFTLFLVFSANAQTIKIGVNVDVSADDSVFMT